MTEVTQLKSSSPIKESNFKPAEFTRIVYYAIVEASVRAADLKKPDYWAHVAQSLKQGDRIEVEAEDGSYFAELFVQDVGRTWVKVAVLREIQLDNTAKELPQELKEYDVTYKGKISKWCVVRLGDQSLVYEGGNMKQDAVNWLTEHVKALAA